MFLRNLYWDLCDLLSGHRRPKTIEHAIQIVPETNPDRFYDSWLDGRRVSLNDLPPVELRLKSHEKSVEELAKLIMDDHEAMCTGHEKENCPGIPIEEGLLKILRGQTSSWEIRGAYPWSTSDTWLTDRGEGISGLELFLAQEFEGSEPGHPNRDICTLYLKSELGPMEFEIWIPHHGIRNGYLQIVYLRVDLEIDSVGDMIITGHQDDLDLRPT